MTGLDQSDAFTLTTIFERRAHVRVVMRAAFSSAVRAAGEEIVNGFSVGERHHPSRVGLEVFSLLHQDALVQTPQRRSCTEEGTGAEVGVFQRRRRAAFAWLIKVLRD